MYLASSRLSLHCWYQPIISARPRESVNYVHTTGEKEVSSLYHLCISMALYMQREHLLESSQHIQGLANLFFLSVSLADFFFGGGGGGLNFKSKTKPPPCLGPISIHPFSHFIFKLLSKLRKCHHRPCNVVYM